MSWIGDIFAWLGKTLSKLWGAVKPETVKLVKLFFVTFEDAALAAVEAEALKAITGQEKFDNAVAAVQAVVIKAGWKASQTMIETLVQDAYMTLKASRGELTLEAPAG